MTAYVIDGGLGISAPLIVLDNGVGSYPTDGFILLESTPARTTSANQTVPDFTQIVDGGPIFFDGFERNNFDKWPAGGGTVSIDTTIVNRDTYSCKIPSQTGFGFKETANFLSASTLYSRFYVYITATPTNESAIYAHEVQGTGNISEVHIDTSRHVVLWNVSGGLPANAWTGTAVIPLNTWTCIEVKEVIGAGTGILECRVNGVVDQTQTGLTNNQLGNIQALGIDNVAIVSGSYNSAPTGTDVYFDDIAISTTGYPGLLGGSLNATVDQTVPAFSQTATLGLLVQLGASQSIPAFVSDETLKVIVQNAVNQVVPDFVGAETLKVLLAAQAAQTIPAFGAVETVGSPALPDLTVIVDQIIPAFSDTETLAALIKAQVAQTIPAFGQSATDTVTVTLVQASDIPAFTQSARIGNRPARNFAFIII